MFTQLKGHCNPYKKYVSSKQNQNFNFSNHTAYVLELYLTTSKDEENTTTETSQVAVIVLHTVAYLQHTLELKFNVTKHMSWSTIFQICVHLI